MGIFPVYHYEVDIGIEDHFKIISSKSKKVSILGHFVQVKDLLELCNVNHYEDYKEEDQVLVEQNGIKVELRKIFNLLF